MSARVRGLLGQLPGAIALILLVQLAAEPARALRDVRDTDYVAFAAGARLLHVGACLYCKASQFSAQAGLVGPVDPATAPRFVNPPPAALVLEPLDRLPLAAGLAIFLGVLLASLLLAGLLAVRLLGGGLALRSRATLVVLSLASAPAAWGVALGQWDPIVVAAELGSVALAERRRPIAAGLLASVGLVKPQLVWFVPVVLLVGRWWRMLAGFAAGAVIWLLSSLLLAGRGLADLLPLLRTDEVGAAGHSPAVVVVLAAGAVAVAVVVRRALRLDVAVAMAAGCGLSLLCSPHLHSDDYLLLAVPLLVLGRTHYRAAVAGALALTIAYLVDTGLTTHGAQAEVAVGAVIALGSIAAARGAWPRRPLGTLPSVA